MPQNNEPLRHTSHQMECTQRYPESQLHRDQAVTAIKQVEQALEVGRFKLLSVQKGRMYEVSEVSFVNCFHHLLDC